jgi:hypothetical protein
MQKGCLDNYVCGITGGTQDSGPVRGLMCPEHLIPDPFLTRILARLAVERIAKRVCKRSARHGEDSHEHSEENADGPDGEPVVLGSNCCIAEGVAIKADFRCNAATASEPGR